MTEQALSISDGLVGTANVFVDPAATAKRVPAKWSWLWPILLLSIGWIIVSQLMLPYRLQLVDINMSQRNISGDQLERAQSIGHMITRVSVWLAPVFVVLFTLLFAWLVSLMCSIFDARPRFRNLFSLLAACSLIPMIQAIAGVIVLRAKGSEIQTQQDLQPPFGIDIFLQHTGKMLGAFLGFFSIFQIWFIVVLVFGLAALTGMSKGKAFVASTPAWLLPLLLSLAGAAFSH